MRYKVIYENNRGQRVNLSERPYFLNIEPILDYQWSYSEKEKRRGNIIAGFAKDIQSVDLTLHIMDANADARDEAVDYFNNVIEADIYDGIAGRLIIGDWYTWGYIIASKNTKWQYGNPVVKKVVKLVREQENWYHVVQKANYGSEQAEELYNFVEEDIKTYEGADTNSLKSLKVSIEPKQAGSGDPSPDNVRPISGWDSVGVTRSGKNLFYNTYSITSAGVNYTVGNDASEIVVKGTSAAQSDAWLWSNNVNRPFYLPSGEYTISISGLQGDMRLIFSGAGNNGVPYYELKLADGNTKRTFTVTDGTKPFNYFVLRASAGQTFDTTVKVQIEKGTTATDYEPYQADTYTTDLPETVYGGSLDVVNGVLNIKPYYASYNGETLSDEWISDRDVYSEGRTPTIGAQVVNVGATGTNVQLTPKQVTTLLGTNNVWADSGDVTVEYWDDAGRIKTASGSVVTFSRHNTISGAGYDYPYDYMADAQSQKRIENPNSVPCDFSITIQGYVDRPAVQIGDNVIAFDLEVPYGAFLTVDSSKKTAIMTLANGEQVNVFGARDPDYYLFEKIKEGKNTVTWNGSFLWEIRMLEERSEPRWRMD